MGITGTHIKPSENINDLINNKIDTAYYILDDILFNYIIEKDLVTDVNKEITEVKLVFNVYNNYTDRVNRKKYLEQIVLTENITKNTNYGNLWETYYIKCKILLKKYLENILMITLQMDDIINDIDNDEIPNEYQNLISFTDT
tara:strand:- start:642 stop:1070 length:429 start_codon:yes stop_codon:yes gene_type:complete